MADVPRHDSVRAGYDRWALVYDHDMNPLPALEERPVLEDSSGPVATQLAGAEPIVEFEPIAELEPILEPEPIDPERVAPMPLRALIAEDSLSARLALTAMIETHGLEAHAVRNAAELFEALEDGPWALVCVDVDLPDARGAAMLRAVRDRLRADEISEADLVALVREGEEDIAREAGVVRSLRKPWNRAALERLLTELGFSEDDS